MLSNLRASIVCLAAFTLLCGVVYPALVRLGALTLWPAAAEGSFLERDGVPVGSAWIGRAFDGPGVFHGRPSATSPPYSAAASGGSNQGPDHPGRRPAVIERAAALSAREGAASTPWPADLLTASASGLDPHISPEAARLQATRVARVRGLAVESVLRAVDAAVEPPWLGIFGSPRVNVLRLNLAVDALGK